MQHSELLAYLRSQRLGVLGTLAPSGEPQAALVGYAVTPGLQIVFDTLQTTRKYRNMMANPCVSFTVGNTAAMGMNAQRSTKASQKNLLENRCHACSRSISPLGRIASRISSGRISHGS